MTKQKPKVPKNADDKDQSKLFIEAALERETDDTGRTLEKAFKTVTSPSSATKTDQKKS